MQIEDMVVLVLLALLVMILFGLAKKNSKIVKENILLKEILQVKDATIAKLEAQRTLVGDLKDNMASSEDVLQRVEEGKSREEISKELGIPLSKVELIIKFDEVKRSRMQHDA